MIQNKKKTKQKGQMIKKLQYEKFIKYIYKFSHATRKKGNKVYRNKLLKCTKQCAEWCQHFLCAVILVRGWANWCWENSEEMKFK